MSTWDFSDSDQVFGDETYAMDGSIGTSSRTGGILAPNVPYPLDDESLDAVLQTLVSEITGLDGTLVRPRWQPVVPKRPDPSVNWCAIGIISSTPDAGPTIGYDPLNNVGPYTRHETMELVATFYGPNSKQFAAILRDGLAIPQNCDVLRTNAMAYVECGQIRAAPEFINEQWVKRQDMTITLRREINRSYAILSIATAVIEVIDDLDQQWKFSDPISFGDQGSSFDGSTDTLLPENIVGTIIVPPGTLVEP